MRRLPIYFLIDISESMVGDPMQQVEEGMATIMRELKTDPNSLETVWISIIGFAGLPKTLVPLQELVTFYPPKFPIGSGTSLSSGLGHLMFELRRNFVKTTYEQKGDWKPIIFLFTDGVPTDDTTAAINEWKSNWARTANMVAIGIGDEVDTSILSQLTENVLIFKNTDAGAYRKFFKWITDSIKTSSESVDKNGSGFELSKFDEEIITKIDLSKPQKPFTGHIDQNYVVLAGKCQNTHRPYLIKYKKFTYISDFSGYHTKAYKLEGAFPLDKTYYELTGENAYHQKINTQELIGSPTCPCCGNQYGIAMCGCGEIHCIGDDNISDGRRPPKKMSTCPSCNMTGSFGVSEGGFDINRSQG
jgi:uncharacterized protein YegL